jgi:transposase
LNPTGVNQVSHKGRGYSSDLTDEQWAMIEPLLPLLHDYPNYNSVYYHYRNWCADETWDRINTA